jgi:hypothetical protein
VRKLCLVSIGLLLALLGSAAAFSFTETIAAATPKKVFTSTRYGYSLVLPKTWSMQQTRGKWSVGAQPLQGGPGVDAFWTQTSNKVLVGAARPVAAGTTFDAWAEQVASLTPEACATSSPLPSNLGGEPAERWEIRCSDNAHVIKVAALHGGRGYLFALVSDIHSKRADRAFFAGFLRTFKFTH